MANDILDIKREQTEMKELKHHDDLSVKGSGTTYVRWGRTTCPGNGSEIIYSGYAGGSYTGAAVSLLCLPLDPDWALHTDTEEDYSGYMYGAEYQPNMGRTDQFFGIGHADQDVPCVVCNVKGRSSAIMVPGKTRCHPGWTSEYTGYLMLGHHHQKAATDYYCIDKEPEVVSGGSKDENGKLLSFVEARCGALKCPPYVNGRELTCVVCSK